MRILTFQNLGIKSNYGHHNYCFKLHTEIRLIKITNSLFMGWFTIQQNLVTLICCISTFNRPLFNGRSILSDMAYNIISECHNKTVGTSVPEHKWIWFVKVLFVFTDLFSYYKLPYRSHCRTNFYHKGLW